VNYNRLPATVYEKSEISTEAAVVLSLCMWQLLQAIIIDYIETAYIPSQLRLMQRHCLWSQPVSCMLQKAVHICNDTGMSRANPISSIHAFQSRDQVHHLCQNLHSIPGCVLLFIDYLTIPNIYDMDSAVQQMSAIACPHYCIKIIVLACYTILQKSGQ